jgi:hypothetical protein
LNGHGRTIVGAKSCSRGVEKKKPKQKKTRKRKSNMNLGFEYS